MENVEDKAFGAQDVIVFDNKSFLRCSFVRCTIVYSGGVTKWHSCHFDTCRIVLKDAANRTKEVLEGFGFKISPPNSGYEIPGTGTIQ